MKFKRFNKTYVSIKKLFGLENYEVEPMKTILTIALHISREEDKVIGFQIEKVRKCIFCKEPTSLYAIFQRSDSKKLFMHPICHNCLKFRLESYIKLRTAFMLTVLRETTDYWITRL